MVEGAGQRVNVLPLFIPATHSPLIRAPCGSYGLTSALPRKPECHPEHCRAGYFPARAFASLSRVPRCNSSIDHRSGRARSRVQAPVPTFCQAVPDSRAYCLLARVRWLRRGRRRAWCEGRCVTGTPSACISPHSSATEWRARLAYVARAKVQERCDRSSTPRCTFLVTPRVRRKP